ncbi:MAG: hypothetical protein RIT81_17215 [Deltaproteobacteria bacterium]
MKTNHILLTLSMSAIAGLCLVSSPADARPGRAQSADRDAASRRARAERGDRDRVAPRNAVDRRARPAPAPRRRVTDRRARPALVSVRSRPAQPNLRRVPYVRPGAVQRVRDIARDWNHAVAARDRRRLRAVDQRLASFLRTSIDQADRAAAHARGSRRASAHAHSVAVRELARDLHRLGSRRHPFTPRHVQQKRTKLYQLVQLTEHGRR